MALLFYPKPGTVLMCDFDGFKPPEMVKRRPVLVLSSQSMMIRKLVTVVPLSTSVPFPRKSYHYELSQESLPINMRKKANWAKYDMLYTVGFHRLDRIKLGRAKHSRKRKYGVYSVTDNDFAEVQKAVLAGLGFLDK